jgi:ABC-type transporter Mla subunit MlaD
VVTADSVLPQVIQDALAQITTTLNTVLENQGKIMSSMADEQATINNVADAVNAVAAHVTAASASLQDWITAHEGTIDTSGLAASLSSLQAADSTLQAVVPQAPAAPLDTPVPDPGPPADSTPASDVPPPDVPTADPAAPSF